MDISIEVVESANSFREKVIQAICDQLSFKFLLSVSDIENDIKTAIPALLKNTNEYKKLTTDPKTIADFGFTIGSQFNLVNAIIQKVADSIKVSQADLPFKARPNSISGSLSIGILIENFSDILNMPEAVATTTKKGFHVKWLDWLLTKGTVSIINNYHVDYGNFGRSREGHMVLSGTWHVDKEISGDVKDNWLTRALVKDAENLRDELDKIIVSSIQKHLRLEG